jgi:hypothetical protein
LRVERQSAGSSERCSRLVDACGQRLPAEVGRAREGGVRCTTGGVVVGDGQVALRPAGDGVGGVDRPVYRTRRKAGDGGRGTRSEVAIDDRRAGIGDPGAGQHGETSRRAEADRCFSRAGYRRGDEGGHTHDEAEDEEPSSTP